MIIDIDMSYTMFVGFWHNINTCVLCFHVLFVYSFAMITYLVGADEVAGVEAHLVDDELSIRVVEGLDEF